MNSRTLLFLLTICALTLTLSSCGKEKLYTVSGTASYQGEPIPDGSISFVPSDPKLSPQGASIRDGKYTAQVRKGTMTVKITGSKIDPKQKMEDGSPFWTDFVPEKYSTQSTLTVEITGNQTENFDLE